MSNDINDALGISGDEKQPDNTNAGIARKYPALRTLSGILTFIAWLIAVLTVIAVVILITNSHSSYDGGYSAFYTFGVLAIGAISFITLLAYSELIKVFIDIEENTRRTANK